MPYSKSPENVQAVWDIDTGGVRLTTDNSPDNIRVEVRPVFFEELDLLKLNQTWKYPKTEGPLLWATAGRRYFYRGRLVAETRGGGFFEKPEVILYERDLLIEPVDVPAMLDKNAHLMENLVQI
jgi:phosphoadenosine phosphosulfate reductase